PAIFEEHDVPTEVSEQVLIALPQTLADHGVEALPVVVDDPPAIAQALLPAFEHSLEDVALVELGIAEQRDHAAFRPFKTPTVSARIVSRDRHAQRLSDAEADRTGGKIDVVSIFGARRIGLRALIAAEVFELLARLTPEQILNGMEVRRGMRFDRDAILRPQAMKIKGGHDRGERRRRRLMATDFYSVGIVAQIIGLVDRPGCEPQHLALELGEDR